MSSWNVVTYSGAINVGQTNGLARAKLIAQSLVEAARLPAMIASLYNACAAATPLGVHKLRGNHT